MVRQAGGVKMKCGVTGRAQTGLHDLLLAVDLIVETPGGWLSIGATVQGAVQKLQKLFEFLTWKTI